MALACRHGWVPSKAHNRSESDKSVSNCSNLGSCVCVLGEERPYLPGRRLCSDSGCGRASKGVVAGQKEMRRRRDENGKEGTRREEGEI